ncbi:MAG: nitroreductase [Clostridia bacterium]|nr:nitroreductase [Clostridia bacterium]
MTLQQAMQNRHSVRQYLDTPLTAQQIAALRAKIDEINKTTGLHIQLFTEEPDCFTGALARYGSFSGVRNYIAMVGKKGKDLAETIGYHGEELVLLAQTLGLNTCWVALTFSKRKCKAVIGKGEKMPIVISLGYGATQGHDRKCKAPGDVAALSDDDPQWYRDGVAAALNAPTAINQQKFYFTRKGTAVTAKATGGVHSDIDLGIVKLHFALGAGTENFTWGDEA